ncbi:MAG TPA: hypothetical protein VGA26_03975, partial [Candidatus Limnocylindria bacterium]
PPTIDPETGEPTETVVAPITSVVIVFAGTNQDAEIIRMVQRTETDRQDSAPSTLSVTLRTNDDDALETTTGITLESLVEDYGVLVPDLEDIVGTTEPAQ